jgi:DNA-binding transcriptional MerR regulator
MTEIAKTKGLLKIGQLARMAGVTTRTLRFYESLDLIRPESRSAGGFRLYSPDTLRSVRIVLALKEAGLSLGHIQRLHEVGTDSSKVPAEDFLRSLGKELEKRRLEVRRRIDVLAAALKDLDAACDVLGRCPGCGGKVFDCECMECLADKVPGIARILAGLLDTEEPAAS